MDEFPSWLSTLVPTSAPAAPNQAEADRVASLDYAELLTEPDEQATLAHMRKAAALAVELRQTLHHAVETSRPILTLLLAGHAEAAAELQSDLASSVAYYEDDLRVARK